MSIMVFEVDRGSMTDEDFRALCAILGTPHAHVYPLRSTIYQQFHCDVSHLSEPAINRITVSAFNQCKAASISTFIAVRCPFCEQPRMLHTNECGGYGLGKCERSSTYVTLTNGHG